MTITIPQYQEITTDQQLKDASLEWMQNPWIALDTEFVRERTYYPIAGLIQLATESAYYLVDPLTIVDKDPLVKLFENKKIVKILHSSSEDLELFSHFLGALPDPLFDTQIAAAFLGYGMSLGYKNLVSQLFTAEIEKQEQRSNWVRRPLSKEQKDYAILDVVYLGSIYQQQRQQLETDKRLTWVQEECARLVMQQQNPPPASLSYQRVKGAWQLDGRELAVLQALAEWRDVQASVRDIPRGFLLKDGQLLQLVRQRPATVDELKNIEDIHPKVIRKDGDTIIALLKVGQTNAELPLLPTERLSKPGKSMLAEVKTLIAAKTSVHNIAPELVSNRKGLTAMISSLLEQGNTQPPQDFANWKRELLGDDLADLLVKLKGDLSK